VATIAKPSGRLCAFEGCGIPTSAANPVALRQNKISAVDTVAGLAATPAKDSQTIAVQMPWDTASTAV
jgi:hypothetical protein